MLSIRLCKQEPVGLAPCELEQSSQIDVKDTGQAADRDAGLCSCAGPDGFRP